MMYSIIYSLYFSLRRKQRENLENQREDNKWITFTINYIEWFYNILIARLYRKYPSKRMGTTKKKRNQKIIVSLTSFPKRIGSVWLTIETLLRQTVKPDDIILWLADSQFEGMNDLPRELVDLQKRGLTIRFCDDLRSHKKYYYTMKEHPDDIIILVDDDSFYPYDTVERLLKLHNKNVDEIICMTPTMISEYNELPSNWHMPSANQKIEHSYLAQPYSGQGTLYPPHCLDEEFLFNKELIMELCPFADDLWLKYMSLRKKTKVTMNYKLRDIPVTIYGTAANSLWYINGQEGKNDAQWNNILSYFGKIEMK